MDVINLASKTQSLPESMAIITVLHKKNKDPLKCSSFRPISLLNADYKLISKALANRLSKFLPKLINLDQVGFIQKRSSASNMCRLLNVIHMASSNTEPSIAVTLDAEKTFDMHELPYLFKVLSKFGFGSNFINWVRTLYHEPQAKIITNGYMSAIFPLSRQGCPLSPGLLNKINLMADDIILYLTNPFDSLVEFKTVLYICICF